MREALDIRVKGIVQGVGFRPFVYRLARAHGVSGWVLNAVDGVTIHAEGESASLDNFVMGVSEEAPPAAQVSEIDLQEAALQGFDGFEIRFSDDTQVQQTTLVSSDLATCADCERELFDPADRRFRYPFINCTNCGPRFTITESLPYDRPHTSMAGFDMCPSCAAEYADPADRRFHAQPDACFDCGPHVYWAQRAAGEGCCGDADGWAVSWGASRRESDEVFARAVALLKDGGIVAVKGLGGFHLVCDAENPRALASLRARKRRSGRAFAVMVPDVAAARRLCLVGDEEAAVLSGPQRPIVLLRKRPDARFAAGLADGLAELGVMLPCTPVQHLLMRDFAEAGGTMLVMTSGNIHDEPIVTDDAEALSVLGSIADAVLGNNRPILSRYDDSVLRVLNAGQSGAIIQFIRRARGYAPVPLGSAGLPADGTARRCEAPGAAPCPSDSALRTEVRDGLSSGQSAGSGRFSLTDCANLEVESADVAETLADATNDLGTDCVNLDEKADAPRTVFAAGPEQKNTFCILRAGEAFVSQHIGDMENAETSDAWMEAKARYEALFRAQPTEAACDMHPDYLPSKWARSQSLPVYEVQHHHAHIASVMAEHGLTDAVCGIAFDGTGYGVDGAIWGGEVLLANQEAFERFANFSYVPMPGGAAAIKHPLRMAYGVLWAYDLTDHPAAERAFASLGGNTELIDQMIERGINTPYTSSVGRLFDAASALLGICTDPTYEGEPAILLEAAISQGAGGCDAPGGLDASKAPVASDDSEAHGLAAGDAPEAPVASPDEEEAAARYAVSIVKNTATESSTAQDTSVVLLDAEATFRALLDDVSAGVPTAVIARRFHDAFVAAIVTAAELVRAVYGIETVALSGGVFMNRYLMEHAVPALAGAGFTVAVNRDLPPNDGCVSLGQAVIAWQAGRAEQQGR